jgi:hypothetical protein
MSEDWSDMSDDNENGTQGEQGEQGEEQKPEPSYYLTRSTMLPVEGVIYCLTHTVVHEDTVNPYGEGEESWCKKEDHRSLYYRGHKGDIDERLDEDARRRNEPQHGNDRPAPRRMIAAGSQDGLTKAERGLVLRLIRTLHTTLTETRETLSQILGKSYIDAGETDPLLELTGSILDKLGGENGDSDGD